MIQLLFLGSKIDRRLDARLNKLFSRRSQGHLLDKWIETGDAIDSIIKLAKIHDLILSIRQISNIGHGVVKAAIPILADPIAFDLHPGQFLRLKKRMQDWGVLKML